MRQCYVKSIEITPKLCNRSWFFLTCIKFLFLYGLSLSTSWCAATTMVYVANADSQDISVFQLDKKSGRLAPIQRFVVDGVVMPIAIARNKNLLYAALRSEPYRVLVLKIDPATGLLALHGSGPLVDNMANISLDFSETYLFGASYSGNKISVNALDNYGIPQASAQVFATGAHPHQITADATNQLVYVSLLGADRLDCIRFDATAAKFQPIKDCAARFPSGTGPRHFVLSPQGKFLFVLGELNASLTVLKRNKTTGKMTLIEHHRLLPAESSLKPWAADIHLTPDGKFLYATERTSNSLFGFKVNQISGRLSAVGSWHTESQPRAFAISPDGRYLTVVGQKSNYLSLYAINKSTGTLSALARAATGINPSWVEMILLPDEP